MSIAGGVVVALGLLMTGTSMLKVNGDKGEWVATPQKLCDGSAAASSRYARRDLRCACTELLRGVDVGLILDQFGELITCPIQQGDGAKQARQRREALLQTIADDEVPPRPGRSEPLVCKDRQNKYTFMTQPRYLYNLEDNLAHAS